MGRFERFEWESFRDGEFIRRVLIVFGLAALAYLFWHLTDVLLLAFGAVLVAVVLHAFADLLSRYAFVPRRWSLTVATLIVFAIFAAVLVSFGAQVRAQLAGLTERLPLAIDSFSRELGFGEVSHQIPQALGMGPGGGFISRLAGIGGSLMGGLADVLLVVIAGLYIAASPRVYRQGLVKLFPPSQHDRVETSLDAAGQALRLWLISQFLAMTCVFVLVTATLWYLGLPSPIALGLIAGLADFIPFVGPVIGAIPAVLIASSIDTPTALWTIAAFVVIQQIEGNIIFPILGRRMVSLPPALALFAILACGTVFGILGVVFGFPLAVVIYVLIKKLYVRETLGEETPVPGEKETPGVTSG
jgi:predicted PurR-regulated permease PerM